MAGNESVRAAGNAEGRSFAEQPKQEDRKLMDMMDEARARLQNMEISCRDMMSLDAEMAEASSPARSEAAADRHELQVLGAQVAHLKTQLLDAIARLEHEDQTFQRASEYDMAKSTANAVLHMLFDQTSAGKVSVLRTWLDTGVIPTRNGLKHWKLDPRTVRNAAGATLLHVAVEVSMAPQATKVKLVKLLVDRAGFDPNVRNVFGRTPLHEAAMSGYVDVMEALLGRGSDPLIQDRAGLTALSLVRTLSRPRKEVVQALVQAESAMAKDFHAGPSEVSRNKAIASAMFLKSLSRFSLPEARNTYLSQTATLLDIVLAAKCDDKVSFDRLVRENVPLLFDATPACHVARLDTLFLNTMYWDPAFIDELKVEANGYALSLVSPAPTTGTLAGPIWVGVLLKMIQYLKVEVARPEKPTAESGAKGQRTAGAVGEADSLASSMDVDALMEDSPGSLSTTSPATSQSHPAAAHPPIYYADRAATETRQAWYYAVLLKAATHALPGTVTVKEKSNVVVCSEDVTKYFPLEDRLAIGSGEYFATEYDPQSRQILLDRDYEGEDASNARAYLTGSCSSGLPPYIMTKRIWERDPGNKFEDQNSKEQELFQDYQFMDPESDYEVAFKLGPIPNSRDARAVADEWKKATKDLFNKKECTSGLKSCENYYCPQRSGHSLCVGSMANIGIELAKRHFKRATFLQPMKPRASLQKLQNRFKGTDAWPGSPAVTKASSKVDAVTGKDGSSDGTADGNPTSAEGEEIAYSVEIDLT